MRIRSAAITGFRSFDNLSIDFEDGITVLVGENGTGKSSISAALSSVFDHCRSEPDQVAPTDHPFGVIGEMKIELGLDLSSTDVERDLVPHVAPSGMGGREAVLEWLQTQINDPTLVIERPCAFADSVLRLKDVSIYADQLYVGPAMPQRGGTRWIDSAEQHVQGSLPPGMNVFQLLGSPTRSLAADRYKVFSEFRLPVSSASRTARTESFEGSETASVLLNLKNHADEAQRQRYGRVQRAFDQFFPRLQMEAVEQTPGSGTPDIQFKHHINPRPLSLVQVSAGVHEVLTMVTNLVARENLVIFIEHPETHLHPHAIRALRTLIVEASERNQIIVSTHNSEFVDPGRPESLRRLCVVPEYGTQVTRIDQSDPKSMAQMRTALRLVGSREAVFARSVALVEDESQQEFLRAVASTLGRDIDAKGVSVISVDGETGYKPFFTLLGGLGIPCVGLKDKH